MTGRPGERAVSEMAGVAILVAFTVLVTASVGVSVLFVDADADAAVSANFTFEYRSAESMLLVTHDRGDAIPAGDIVLEGDSGSVTWAAVSGAPDNQTVGPGDLIQLSDASAWDAPVARGDTVEIYHVPGDGNRTLLGAWSG